jgi:tetratricopeptide (TPR) repeat protein
MVPLALGIVMTTAVSWIPIYILFPERVEEVTNQMIREEREVLADLSRAAGSVTHRMVQSPLDFLLLITLFEEKYRQGGVEAKERFEMQFVNGEMLALGKEVPPGYDQLSQVSYQASTWYINPNQTAYTELAPSTQADLRSCAVMDFLSLPCVSFPQTPIPQVYRAYASTGLMYLSPAQNKSYYLSYSGDPPCALYFDPRCRPWFRQVQASPQRDLASVTAPYLFAGSRALGQTACAGDWNDEELVTVTCVDFYLTTELVVSQEGSWNVYSYILDWKGAVYAHPSINRTSAKPQSITELELPDCSASEVAYYEEHIVPLFLAGKSAIGAYTRNGKRMLIAVSPIYLNLNAKGDSAFRLSVGVVLAERVLRDHTDSLKAASSQVLELGLILVAGTLVVAIGLGLYLSRHLTHSIIKQIGELSDIVERMSAGDLGVLIEPKTEELPAEIAQLYPMFARLKTILKFAKSSPNASDTDALVTNAQAMRLFAEVHNQLGTSECAVRMGHLHFTHKRFEEALACYHQAYNLAKELAGSDSKYEELLLNRELALTRALLIVSPNAQQLTLAIDLMNSLAHHYSLLGDPAGLVNCLLNTALAYCKLGNLEAAKSKLMQGSEAVIRGGENWTIPCEILHQRALFVEGFILYSEGRHYEAAEILTLSLEQYDHSDSKTRKFALTYLELIFQQHSLDHSTLSALLAVYQCTANDVIFVLDASHSMAGIKLKKATIAILKFFDKWIKEEDRFSIILAQKIPKILFNLMEKGKNTAFLRGQIGLYSEAKGGTAFFDGLRAAIRELSLMPESEESSELLGEALDPLPSRKKWIVGLLDGEDNASKCSFSRLMRRLSESQVNLAVLGLQVDSQAEMKALCAATASGLFVPCKGLEDLPLAFDTVGRWLEVPNTSDQAFFSL